MRYRILHESRDRVHLALARGRLSAQEADILYYAMLERREVTKVQVFARSGEVCVRFSRSPEELLRWLDTLPLNEDAGVKRPAISARATNEE